LGASVYTGAIDLWSAGCILFELLTSTTLFNGDEEGYQIFEFVNVLGHPQPKVLHYLSNVCEAYTQEIFAHTKDFQAQKLSDYLQMRRTADFTQAEIQKAADLIEKCLSWDPRDRISAEAAS